MKLNIKKGTVYGKLTVLGEGNPIKRPSGQTNRTIKCLCKCGKVKDILLVHLVRARVNSCGCIKRTKNGKSATVYGVLLNSMKTRCKENYFERHLYFDKGITVCKEWLEDIDLFIDFCKKNNYKKGLHIDRIDNSKGYSADNCRFVTAQENANNRDNTIMVNYKKKIYPLKLVLRKIGKENHYNTILARIKRGQEHNEAIDQPIRKGNYKRKKAV